MPTSTKADAQTGTLFETGEVATSKPKRARKTAATDAKPTTTMAKPRARRTKAASPDAVVELAGALVQGVEISAVPGAVIAPASLINGVVKAEDYLVQTSQEVDALMQAACDGHTGTLWANDEQALTRSHAVPGAPHHVKLALSEVERDRGVPLTVLEDLTFAQDPDFNFALLYVSRILAPPSPLPPNAAAVSWIDLDDVMTKIGLDPRSTKDRIAMRNRVWRYLLFGARASIIGQRKGNYVDKRTGERIETIIDEPAWLVMSQEKTRATPTLPRHRRGATARRIGRLTRVDAAHHIARNRAISADGRTVGRHPRQQTIGRVGARFGAFAIELLAPPTARVARWNDQTDAARTVGTLYATNGTADGSFGGQKSDARRRILARRFADFSRVRVSGARGRSQVDLSGNARCPTPSGVAK